MKKTVYKIFVTTTFKDCFLSNEFATREEAETFERENLQKLRKVTAPNGDWDIREVEVDD